MQNSFFALRVQAVELASLRICVDHNHVLVDPLRRFKADHCAQPKRQKSQGATFITAVQSPRTMQSPAGPGIPLVPGGGGGGGATTTSTTATEVRESKAVLKALQWLLQDSTAGNILEEHKNSKGGSPAWRVAFPFPALPPSALLKKS